MSVLEVALDPATVIVAVDPGKAFNRVWISNGSGMLADPMSLSVSRDGIVELELALNKHGRDAPVIAIEATGSLHRPWVTELERRHPGSVRLFAPSETKSARSQLGSGRFKTDDRDCAALTYMARQGGGRRHGQQSSSWIVGALRSWAILGAGDADRSGSAGVRCCVFRTGTAAAIADAPGPWALDDQYRSILAAAVAQMSACARRCRSTCSSVESRAGPIFIA
jgi:hypothetical protein